MTKFTFHQNKVNDFSLIFTEGIVFEKNQQKIVLNNY
jgi:hypothetical protein